MSHYHVPTDYSDRLVLLLSGTALTFGECIVRFDDRAFLPLWGDNTQIGLALAVLTLSLVAATVRQGYVILRRPSRLVLDGDGTLELHSPVGKPHRIAARDIWTAEANRRTDRLLLKGIFRDDISVRLFPRYQDLLVELKDLNPTVRVSKY